MGKEKKRVVFGHTLDGDPDEASMEFRLTFEGRLRATNTGARANTPARKDYKHALRQMFHRQLKRLWSDTPFLASGGPTGPGALIWDGGPSVTGHSAAAVAAKNQHYNFGTGFVPLVTSELRLLCGLDILFLRRQPPGDLFGEAKRGDVDNRLKTLLDVLSVPDENQGYENRTASDDEKPFYCLLQNDRLITKVAIETDLLLDEVPWTVDAETDRENDARLVITVRLRPYELQLGNLQFG
jgi:hypothetical protein